jgi:hypothetical protein
VNSDGSLPTGGHIDAAAFAKAFGCRTGSV